jgi:catechol 2,3-dioxygenase-like lactoylglutathione lyase family enzyme
MIRTDGISHLQLTVRDLERSIHFYAELLGMTEIRRGKTAAMLRTPGSREVFTLNANPEHTVNAGEMGGVAHFGFRMREKADMALVLEDVARAGGRPIDHGSRGDEVYAFFHDPDGYEVELWWGPE